MVTLGIKHNVNVIKATKFEIIEIRQAGLTPNEGKRIQQ